MSKGIRDQVKELLEAESRQLYDAARAVLEEEERLFPKGTRHLLWREFAELRRVVEARGPSGALGVEPTERARSMANAAAYAIHGEESRECKQHRMEDTAATLTPFFEEALLERRLAPVRLRDSFEAWAVENLFSPDTEAGEQRVAFRASRAEYVLSMREGAGYKTTGLQGAWRVWQGCHDTLSPKGGR